MPEEEQAQQKEQKKQEKPTGQTEQVKNEPQDTPASEKKLGGILQWIILAAVILVFTVAGLVLGRLLNKGPTQAEAQTATQQESEQQDKSMDLLLDKAISAKGWYYENLEPVATNLNEPGSTRYVRAALTLEMLPKVDKAKATAFLDERKPIMVNLLNIYFAGLSIEDLNSNKDMRRIQAELLDIFNESLFPDGKPLIKSILFREFGVQ
ncbi:MAG: flagellar basal body-associated FliL family protein [Phycisphaerales bacterium]|jgi:flagellar basal body-associated protein FliL